MNIAGLVGIMAQRVYLLCVNGNDLLAIWAHLPGEPINSVSYAEWGHMLARTELIFRRSSRRWPIDSSFTKTGSPKFINR
jgi:hypothetical protein